MRWPVLVTLVGWGNLSLGLFRMIWPERVLEQVRKGGIRDVRIASGVVGAFGGLVAWMGYFGE